MEYAVGNIAVAISWSDYFTGMMNGFGLKIPEYMTTDFLSASEVSGKPPLNWQVALI